MRNPNSAETHYLLGRACLSELEFELAAAMFERAARLRTDDYQSLVLAGKMRDSAGSNTSHAMNEKQRGHTASDDVDRKRDVLTG